jgi:hypothetical protein
VHLCIHYAFCNTFKLRKAGAPPSAFKANHLFNGFLLMSEIDKIKRKALFSANSAFYFTPFKEKPPIKR